MPDDLTQGSRPVPNSESVAALAALYQGEKTDASYVFNTAMAMMGIAVAYLIGAIPFVDKIGQGPVAWLFLLLLPAPLWLIVAFHSLMALNAMSHGISVQIIEDELFLASELRANRNLVGSRAGDKIMDISQSKLIHRVITVIVYGGVAFLVIGFTAYALYSATGFVRGNSVLANIPVIGIATSIYVLLACMVGLSWIIGLRTIGQGRASLDNLDTVVEDFTAEEADAEF